MDASLSLLARNCFGNFWGSLVRGRDFDLWWPMVRDEVSLGSGCGNRSSGDQMSSSHCCGMVGEVVL